MNINILLTLLSLWICCHLVTSHTIPLISLANNHPFHQQLHHHLNDIHQSQNNIPSIQNKNQRTARGLFSALSGLGNVAAAAAASSNLLGSKDPDDEDSGLSHHGSGVIGLSSSSSSSSNLNKPKPYAFNDVEMTAIQAMISLRNIIGDLLHKVGVNLPSSIASLITRSENGVEKHSLSPTSLLTSGGDSATSSLLSSATSKGNAMLLLRGLALSLPLLIPMANQIRRMSTDTGVVAPSFSSSSSSSSSPVIPSIPFQLPQFDPYGYDRALHRRRGKRSAASTESKKREENQRILRYLRKIEKIHGIHQYNGQSSIPTNDSIQHYNHKQQQLFRRTSTSTK